MRIVERHTVASALSLAGLVYIMIVGAVTAQFVWSRSSRGLLQDLRQTGLTVDVATVSHQSTARSQVPITDGLQNLEYTSETDGGRSYPESEAAVRCDEVAPHASALLRSCCAWIPGDPGP